LKLAIFILHNVLNNINDKADMESKDVIDVHAVFLSFADGSGAIVYERHDTIWANVGGELTIEDDIPYLRAFGFNGDEKTYKLTNIQAGLDIIKCLM
jgi:hypothetical protein